MSDNRPLAVDLFTGLGGWAGPLVDAGFRVVGVDVLPRPDEYPAGAEYVQADVTGLDGARFRGAEVIVASPPCTGFSEAHVFNPHLARPEPADLELVLHTVRVIREAAPRFWAIENVRGARGWFEPIFGPPRFENRPWYVWGHFPAFLLPTSKFPNKTGDLSKIGKRGARVVRGAARRAKIPGELARPFAQACKEALA